MKLLLTVHQFFPHGAGGTEVIVHQTAKELQRRGHDVTIFAAQPCPPDMPYQDRFDEYEYDGLPVQRFHHSYTALQGQTVTTEIEYHNLFFYWKFKKYLADHRPDFVHAFHLHRLSASAADAASELAIPMLFTATDFWFICPTSQLRLPDNSLCSGPTPDAINCVRHLAHAQSYGKMLDRMPDRMVQLTISALRKGWLSNRWFTPHVLATSRRPMHLRERLNRFQKVFCPSRIMRDLLVSNGLQPKLAVHQPYGLNLANIERRYDKGTHPTLRFGFLGQVAEHKGAHLLVQAFLRLPSDAPAELHFYGSEDRDSGYHEQLVKSARGDSRIYFHGPYENTMISNILGSLDVLVAPSIWYENTPIVISEAFTAGLPAIVTDLGGLAEMVQHEYNGLIFPKGDVTVLAAQLQQLVFDRSFVARLASNTRPPKSISAYVTELENAYQELLDTKV